MAGTTLSVGTVSRLQIHPHQHPSGPYTENHIGKQRQPTGRKAILLSCRLNSRSVLSRPQGLRRTNPLSLDSLRNKHKKLVAPTVTSHKNISQILYNTALLMHLWRTLQVPYIRPKHPLWASSLVGCALNRRPILSRIR